MNENENRPSKRLRRQKRNFIVSTIYACLVLTFIYVPVVVMVAFSFNDQEANISWQGFTVKYYARLFQDYDILSCFGLTLMIAVIVTLLSVLIGTIGAVGLVRHEFKGKNVFNNGLYIPVIIPEVVLAVAMLAIFSLVGIPQGTLAIIIGHITLTLPYVVINVKSRLMGYDKSIEEASMDLGANRRQTFMKIILPMIMPGVMSGAFLSFTLSLDDFVVSNFLAGPKSMTLPIKVYSMLKVGIRPQVNALCTIIIGIVAVIAVINLVTGRKQKNQH